MITLILIICGLFGALSVLKLPKNPLTPPKLEDEELDMKFVGYLLLGFFLLLIIV